MNRTKTLDQKLIREILGYDKFLMLNMNLIKKLGVHQAVILTYILDSMEKRLGTNPRAIEEGIIIFRKDLQDKFGISEYIQRQTEKTLLESNILTIETIFDGLVRFNRYKVNLENLFDLLNS